MVTVRKTPKDVPSATANSGTQKVKSNRGLTQKRVKELFDYDPGSGIVTRRANCKEVRSPDKHGHLRVWISGRHYQLHQIIWLWVEGYLPEQGIDHKDRVPYHNWWDNLRLASQQCNLRNAGLRSDNTSGVKGVSFDKPRGKWAAYIAIFSKKKDLGRHTTLDEAVLHRLAAEQCLEWHGCDLDSPALNYVKNIMGMEVRCVNNN